MDNNLTDQKKKTAQLREKKRRGNGHQLPKPFKKDPAVERQMAALPLEQQLAEVLTAAWDQRTELLLSSPQSRELVQAMPNQELFWTVKSTGPETSLYLLELALPEQIQFFLDLDWWQRDEIIPEKVLSWLLILFELGQDFNQTWIKWLHNRDQWIFASILPLVARVVKRPDDMDIQEAKDRLPPFTLDNTYYIAFTNERIAPAAAMLISNLLETSPSIYRDVMETYLWNTWTENREKALKLRRSRLNDMGLNDYHDSIEIYAPLRPDEMHEIPKNILNMDRIIEELPMPLFIPTLYMDGAPLVLQAVQDLQGQKVMARIIFEMIGAVNKLLMADLADLDDPEALSATIQKAFSLLNLGMESLISLKGVAPADILAGYHIEELIRVANTSIRQLKGMARELKQAKLFRYLPEDLRETVDLLHRERPLFHDKGTGKPVPFSSVTHLQETLKRLIKANSLIQVASLLNPVPEEWRNEIDWSSTNLMDLNELELPVAITTGVINLFLGKGFLLSPLSIQDILKVQPKLRHSTRPTENHQQEFSISDETIMGIAGKSGLSKEHVKQLFENCIEDAAQELLPGPDDCSAKELDTRFISTVVTRV